MYSYIVVYFLSEVRGKVISWEKRGRAGLAGLAEEEKFKIIIEL